MTNAKPTSSNTHRARVEEVTQSPADNGDSTDRDPRNFMEIFPNSRQAFEEFMKGGSLSSAQAKIWDKKIKEFIDFVAKMRQKPGLVGSPIYVPTKVSGPRKEPEVITIPDPTSPPPSQKSQSGRVSPPD